MRHRQSGMFLPSLRVGDLINVYYSLRTTASTYISFELYYKEVYVIIEICTFGLAVYIDDLASATVTGKGQARSRLLRHAVFGFDKPGRI